MIGNNISNLITSLALVMVALLLRQQLLSISNDTISQHEIITSLYQNYSHFHEEMDNMQKQDRREYEIIADMINSNIRKLQRKLNKIQQLVNRYGEERMVNFEMIRNLTVELRMERIQMIVREQSVAMEQLENSIKEIIRQTKIKKFDQIMRKRDYFNSEKRKNAWFLQRNNIQTPFMSTLQKNKILQVQSAEQSRLQQLYHMSKYKSQLPFCIIVPSYNNAKNYRFQFNLQSILKQKYQNFHVIIIDDASTDNTGLLLKRFLDKHNISDQKVRVIINKQKVTAVPNIHMAITKYCKPNEIGFFVDGDDQLLGTSAFRIFNAVYQSTKPAIAYSISLQYWTFDDFVKDGWSKAYTLQQKLQNRYRDVPQKISHLRSFRIDLYLQIKQADLKNKDGEWFNSTYDEVICLPMLQMSCGNIQFIQEYNYLYVYGTGYNDRLVDGHTQWTIAEYVKKQMPKYSCKPKYFNQ